MITSREKRRAPLDGGSKIFSKYYEKAAVATWKCEDPLSTLRRVALEVWRMGKHYKQTQWQRWKQSKPEELKIIDKPVQRDQQSNGKPKPQEK